MHKYFIYGFVLCLSVWQNDHTAVETFSIDDLENDLSTSTFMAISNISYVKTKLTLEDFMKFKRDLDSTSFETANTRRTGMVDARRKGPPYRWDMRNLHGKMEPPWMGNEAVHHTSHHGTVMRACHLISATAKAAIYDLKYYYPKRYFYRNLRDFEIGYLTHDIIQTYNTILELYHTIIYQYDMQNFTYFAPPGYMFFIYTNMALLGKHLIHQCNMIAEIEQKFKGSIALFNDSTTTQPPDRADLGRIIQTKDSVAFIRNVTREKQKERMRERKQHIDDLKSFIEMYGAKAAETEFFKWHINEHMKKKRQRQPYRSKWPVSYGWSVEETFKGYSYWSGIHNYSADIDSSDEAERQRQYEELRKNRTKEHCNDKIEEDEDERK